MANACRPATSAHAEHAHDFVEATPSRPSRFSRARACLERQLRGVEARMPILSRVRLTPKPGVSRSTRNIEMPRCVGRRCPSRRARPTNEVGHRAVGDEHLGAVDDVVATVLHRALRMAATSLPPPGSVTAMAVIFSPRQMAGRYVSLSGLACPSVEMGRGHVGVDTDGHRKGAAARAGAFSWQDGRHHDVAPARRTSRRTSRPRKPSSPMRRKIVSHAAAASQAFHCGMTSFSTKDRTVRENISCCSLKGFTLLYSLQRRSLLQLIGTRLMVCSPETFRP